ncbi:MAG: CRISPR-associated endonuclease Cas2, partial [candidate division NC10 bacterium]
KGFGEHLQLSVFQCDLTPEQKVRMVAALDEIIHHEKDQVVFIDLGPSCRPPRAVIPDASGPTRCAPVSALGSLHGFFPVDSRVGGAGYSPSSRGRGLSPAVFVRGWSRALGRVPAEGGARSVA